jgi:hypothetical protein
MSDSSSFSALRFAYADSPYLGCCNLYGHHHEAPYGCWDEIDTHRVLIDYLMSEFPDGWALSASVPSLWQLLPLIPQKGTRICQWSKTFSAFKKGVRPAYAWEPVIVHGGRNPHVGYPHAPPERDGKQNTPKDFYEENGIFAPITLQKGLTGAKSEAVCLAILGWLNFQDGDELVDVFPGTESMTRAAASISDEAVA